MSEVDGINSSSCEAQRQSHAADTEEVTPPEPAVVAGACLITGGGCDEAEP